MYLPDDLLRSLDGLPGFDREAFVEVHAIGDNRSSIRVNPQKWAGRSIHEITGQQLTPQGIPVTSTLLPWCSLGYRLDPRPSYVFDPLLHAGAYYVQEASSMFLGYAVGSLFPDQQGLRVLDLCAAPGGKSTQLASLPQTGLLLSNEAIRSRLPVLRENLVKWGGAHTLISSEDPSAFTRLHAFFDLVVVDAPCSGSGLFRRDPKAVAEWSPEHVELCSRRQRRILSDVLPAMVDGGILIYATCSYSRQEDEDIVDWLVREHGMSSVALEVPDAWGVVEAEGSTGAKSYRFYPDKTAGEGFFLACLKNTGTGAQRMSSHISPPKPHSIKPLLSDWLRTPEELFITEREQEVFAIPATIAADVATLSSCISLRKSGLRLGKILHGQLIPDHELSMSACLHEHLPSIALNRQQAIQFLQRQPVFSEHGQAGWNLASYLNICLGWIKVMPNRWNNYYPQEWRIRKQFAHEED